MNKRQREDLVAYRIILGIWALMAVANASLGVGRLFIGWYLAAAIHFATAGFIYGCYRLFLRPRLRALENLRREDRAAEVARHIAELEKELGIS